MNKWSKPIAPIRENQRALWEAVQSRPSLAALMKRAASAPQSVAFAEGDDPRIVEAAATALNAGLIRSAHFVGDGPSVEAALAQQGIADHRGAHVHDPARSDLFERFAQRFSELRSHKKLSLQVSRKAVLNPLVFANLLVDSGQADGSIGGAVSTTSRTIRAALQVIGKAEAAPLVSSFFLMVLPEDHALDRGAMVFSDCGMVIDPDAQELAAIALQAAGSYAALTGDTPKVGMLSFSTHGSARHPLVSKVATATQALRDLKPDLLVDGEVQLDAALVPAVAASKAPNGPLKGQANVLVFPNLEAGNIGYKMAQRFGDAVAIGPILQGLAKPANDLSRGCSSQDVLAIIAVTASQALALADA